MRVRFLGIAVGLLRWCGGLAMMTLLVAGCAAIDPVSQRETETRVYDSSFELVYNATLSVLTQHGNQVLRADPELGVIETGVLETQYKRVRTKTEVKPLGKQQTQVSVGIYVEERGLMGSTFKPALTKATMYEDLFEEIELQIYRERFLKIERKSREKQ